MRVLLDEVMPGELATELIGHEAKSVKEMGWQGMKNGDLLTAAQKSFDIFISIDRGIPFQQNYASYNIAIIIIHVLDSRIETIRQFIPELLAAIPLAEPGQITWIPSPPRNWRADTGENVI